MKNTHGSAIIMVLVTITILVVLGMAVITLSLGTLTVNKAGATNNDTYYAAEAGVNSAIEQVKTEVAKYYAEMSEQNSDYTSLYDNFFQGIASRSQDSFHKPDIQHMDTHTTFSSGNINEEDNTGDILISCEATAADGTKYVVNGSVKVLRIDLRSGGGEWFFDGIPLYAGGTLDTQQSYGGVTPRNATIVCKNYTPINWAYNTNGNNYTLKVDENAAAAIGDPFPYPSYSNPSIPVLDPALNSNVEVFTSGTSINNVSGISKGIIYGLGDLTVASWATAHKDIYCDGNMSMSNFTLYGNIYCKGNLTISSPIYGDVYCDGIVTISNATFNGNIYCRGGLDYSGGGGFSGNIICDGNVTTKSCGRSGFIMAGGFIKVTGGGNTNCSYYAVGPIDISSAGGTYGVVYSTTELKLGGFNGQGIFFSGGDVSLYGSPSMTALVAKGNIHASSNWLPISYDQSYINYVRDNNPFFFPDSGSGGSGGGITPTSDVIQGQTITAAGRVN